MIALCGISETVYIFYGAAAPRFYAYSLYDNYVPHIPDPGIRVSGKAGRDAST